jgi:hypothetical protein
MTVKTLRRTSRSTETKEANENTFEMNSTSNDHHRSDGTDQAQDQESWVNLENGLKKPSNNNFVNSCIQGPCNGISSAAKVDRISRFFFPFLFLVYNIAYWFTYLNHIAILPVG